MIPDIATTSCDYVYDASSTLTGFNCSTTPAIQSFGGFTSGEIVLSFLVFLIFLGGFLSFILANFLGIKIKRKP